MDVVRKFLVSTDLKNDLHKLNSLPGFVFVDESKWTIKEDHSLENKVGMY